MPSSSFSLENWRRPPGPILPGWRLSSRTWNHWTSPWMKQLTWLRIVHSGEWCLRLALHTHCGACQKWMSEWMGNWESRGQPASPGLPGKWQLKRWTCMFIVLWCTVYYILMQGHNLCLAAMNSSTVTSPQLLASLLLTTYRQVWYYQVIFLGY